MLPPTGNPARTAGHILLVEEYAALGAAFGALLRDAARSHQVHIFRSFAEAENAAGELRPELLVFDIDPPQPGTIAALKRLKTTLPDLRVIVIAAEDALHVTAEPNGPRALRFVKKPFPVGEFEALVQSLITPDRGGTAATLRDLKLVDLLALQALSRARCVLQVDAADDRSGEIHFVDGRITHAVGAGETGAAALRKIVRWRTPRLRELEVRGNAPRTINARWQPLMIEALRAARESAQLTRAEPEPPPPQPPAPPAEPRSKILVIDDTELLLVFVEEVLSTADLNLQILTASSGFEGVTKAAAESPELILLDYSLPDITGGEVCRRLLLDEKTARLPVIMMSGHVPEMLAVADRYENVVASIPKPFLSTALIELVTRTRADLPKLLERARKKKPPEKKAAATSPAKPAATNSLKRRNGEIPVAKPPPAEPVATEVAPKPELISEPAATIEAVPAPPPAEARTSAPPADLVKQTPAPSASIFGFTPAQIHAATKNAVVLTLPLEVVAMQFSPALQMRAIRARPISSVVSIHVLPESMATGVIPEAVFELARVNLDALGRIDTVRLAPTTQARPSVISPIALPLAGISILAASGGPAMELIPAPASPLRMHLTALFELVGVELSPGFRVAHLVMKWRGGKMRLTRAGTNECAGVIFESAQLLLDRSAQIAEILLDAVA
ncbi:MAG: response regulator [Verrucomicrobiota bacterium]|nr:response regulator [Verrucomicrobiota bacterium]